MKQILVIASILSFSLAAQGAVDADLPSYLIKSEKDLAGLKAEEKKAANDPSRRAWLRWQLALNAPQIGHVSEGLGYLEKLRASRQKLIGKDQIDLTKGRLLYQKGQFEQALKAYQSVPKSSEYWFEALEEESWAYIRLGKSDKALSKLTTLMSPVFETWVGPETFFAANYNALKVCDYNRIFSNGKLFKERHSQRIAALEQLAESGANAMFSPVMERLESGELKYLAFAKEAPQMPRFFWRDEFLRRYVNQLKEIKAQGSDMASIEGAKMVRQQMKERMQSLAKAEISEYRTVIQKLHLIEAEVIQRMYLDETLKGQRPELTSAKADPDVLTFPQTDELWIDEVDSYQSKVKACPQLKEAKL